MKFINRQKDIKYLENHFAGEPNSLLFVYGPKSSGKSTLLEKVAEGLDKKVYSINFIDLRQVIIYNFKTFLKIFFPKNIRNKAKDILSGLTVNAGFFSVKLEEESILEENAFKIMADKLSSAKQRGIKPIIIIDEIQMLKQIYIDGERYLIDELFNFFIALTKVKHLAHVVLATSDSYFIEDIYKSAKLAKTSEFFILEHFDKKEIELWLTKEGFTDQEVIAVWNVIGGCPWEINQIIEKKKQGSNIKEILDSIIDTSYGRVFEFIRTLNKEEKSLFIDITKNIVEKGFFEVSYKDESKYLSSLLRKTIEVDIWFYRPEQQKIYANSKSVLCALERIIS